MRDQDQYVKDDTYDAALKNIRYLQNRQRQIDERIEIAKQAQENISRNNVSNGGQKLLPIANYDIRRMNKALQKLVSESKSDPSKSSEAPHAHNTNGDTKITDFFCITIKTLKMHNTNASFCSLAVRSGDTVQSVREKIRVGKDSIVKSKRIGMFFAGKPLEGDQTLACYNISENSTIFIILTECSPCRLTIKTLEGNQQKELFHLDANAGDTVKSTKEKIEEKLEHLHVHVKSLISGKVLGGGILADYKIKEEATLFVILRPTESGRRLADPDPKADSSSFTLSTAIIVGSVILLGVLAAVLFRWSTYKRRLAAVTEAEPDSDLEAQV